MIDVHAVNKKKQKTKTKTKQNKDSINQSPQLFISSDSYSLYSLYRIYSPIIPNKTIYSYHA